MTVSAQESAVIPWPDLGIDGEPELLFQPAVDLATGRLLGFEALLRWNDPVQGRISPKELIPWAEANGYMTALNGWVLSEACAQAVRWRSEIQLAVNCSVFQLRRNEAAAAAAHALEHSGLHPDRLTIEVTETTLADHGAADDLRAISRLGIQLTVDDMGSDWSSLENLQHFAVNTMKIDGSLIDGIDHAGGVNRAIVETIVKVSHSLDLCTVAEAVETAAQVAILRELGADVGQGYFFAPPLAADETLALTDMDLLPIFPLTDPTHAGGEATEELIPERKVVRQSVELQEPTAEVPEPEAEVPEPEAEVPEPEPEPEVVAEEPPAPQPDPSPHDDVAATGDGGDAVADGGTEADPGTDEPDTEKVLTTAKTPATAKTKAAGSTKAGSTGRKSRRKPAPRRGHAA
ncbi:MAG TPA: EAL domain-containing protein [Acidimicrobiales bacterium]|nr:EAL domain-containing protein [Acidimicrobiales bacterium]